MGTGLNGFCQNAFFLKRTDSLSAQNHSDFLAVNHEGFLLKIRLEDTFSATQREADIVAKLLAFSGEFTSCCHNLLPLIFYNLYQFTFFIPISQVCWGHVTPVGSPV